MPELYDDLMPIWEAWGELNKRRSFGFTANPIPTSEVAAYLDLHDVEDSEQRRYYFLLVGALDEEWLVWARNKSKDGTGKQGEQKTSERE